jgi:hypothetical protein
MPPKINTFPFSGFCVGRLFGKLLPLPAKRFYLIGSFSPLRSLRQPRPTGYVTAPCFAIALQSYGTADNTTKFFCEKVHIFLCNRLHNTQ